MKNRKLLNKGLSLSELGISLVILLIVSTIAIISYFSIIDNAKEVKIIENTETLQLALLTQGIDINDYSTEYKLEDLDHDIQEILKYHLEQDTNLKGVVFPNEVIIDSGGNYVLGELKVKKSELGKNTALLDLLNISQVKADNNSLNLEIRKLDNNKIKKLFNGSFSGEWFIISNYKNNNLSNNDKEENLTGGFLVDYVQITEDNLAESEYKDYTPIRKIEDFDIIRGNLEGNYILMNDLDLSGIDWEPIGSPVTPFKGKFNGNGHVISNITVDRIDENNAGLFGYVKSIDNKNIAIINNLSLKNINIKGKNHIGSIVGYLGDYSVISNSYAEGSINGLERVGGLVGYNGKYGKINNSYFIGYIEGTWGVGGLVGQNSQANVVLNSYFIGDITGIEDVGGLVGLNKNASKIDSSFSSGNVVGELKVGGLVGSHGLSNSEIINSYSNSNVFGETSVGGLVGLTEKYYKIYYSYSSGKVTGTAVRVGGLIGGNENITYQVSNGYWDIERSGQSTSRGGNGKSSDEMKQEITYQNWDFETVWVIDEGNDYPRLQWEKQ